MDSLKIKSWEKAGAIYRWNLLITVIIAAVVIPYLFPIKSTAIIFRYHIQWRAVVIIPLFYILTNILPSLVAVIIEGLIYLFTRKFSTNDTIAICYAVWIIQTVFILIFSIDLALFGHEHHFHSLLP